MKAISNISLILSFLLIALNISYAQEQETYMVHIDKPMYVTGEKIFYKLYFPALKEKVAVRVLLVDAENQVLQDFFAESNNQDYVASCLSIPYHYASGMYKLVFNTNVKRSNVEEELTLTDIEFPIYNDLSSDNLSIADQTAPATASEILNSGLQIRFSNSNTTFQTRDNINFNFEVSTSAGNPANNASVSVAVIPKQIAKTTDLGYSYLSVGQQFDESILPLLAEDVYVKGTVFNRGDRPIKLNIIGAYADQFKSMQYTKSNDEGKFTMRIPGLYGNQEIQFLPYENEIKNFKIKLEEAILPQPVRQTFHCNEEIAQVLDLSRKQKKITQYFKLEDNALVESNPNTVTSEEVSNAKFIVSEYEKFDLVYDFFSELITPLNLKKVKGEIVASMNNPKSTRAVATALPGNPLFIIDGKLTRNADYAGNLKMSNVETINLIYSPDKLRKSYNVLGLSGVVIINTITPVFDFPENDYDDVFQVNGLQGQCDFMPFKSSESIANTPHFRSTIYWNPDLRTDSSGKVNIRFDQTDNTGDFSVIIVAQDKNGQRATKVIDYTVNSSDLK